MPLHETIELLGGPLDGSCPKIPQYTLGVDEVITAYEPEIRLYDQSYTEGRWRYEYNWDTGLDGTRIFNYKGVAYDNSSGGVGDEQN
jgi:hypothetical protein